MNEVNVMNAVSAVPTSGLRPLDRSLGMIGAWTVFVVNEAYAITSGLGYLSVKAPSDPISDPYLSIMSILIVLMAPFLVLTMVAVYSYAPAERKSYALAALGFMILTAGVTSTVNFSLFAVARQPAAAPAFWSASFITSAWPPLPQAVDTFAWDWFFALSMLLAAPIFGGGRLKNAVRAVMLLSAGLCILGFVLLPFSPSLGTIIGIIGWGVAGPIVFLLLANLFTRLRPDPVPSPAG